jgi:Tol biopolymer transport system component
VYAGDIWLVAAQGGRAERLTAHPAGHMLPRWSPDGAAIACTSTRTGQGDVYVVPLDGGEVRRLTYHDTQSAVECWSPDGDALYFTSQRERQGTAIYRVAISGDTPIHGGDVAQTPMAVQNSGWHRMRRMPTIFRS